MILVVQRREEEESEEFEDAAFLTNARGNILLFMWPLGPWCCVWFNGVGTRDQTVADCCSLKIPSVFLAPETFRRKVLETRARQ